MYEQHHQQHRDGTQYGLGCCYGGGPGHVTWTGNGGHAPSPIDPLSQEALNALHDDQQRQVVYDRHPSYKRPQSAVFAQGFACLISTAPQMQQQPQ